MGFGRSLSGLSRVEMRLLLRGGVKKESIVNVYGIDEWNDEWDFLEKLANKCAKLLQKGEPDFNNVAVQMINDYQRGKLPWFIAPPMRAEELTALEQKGDDAPLNDAEAGEEEKGEVEKNEGEEKTDDSPEDDTQK
ncbi:Nucleolar GTP-binding protein 2 [Phytophthora megakarya]|uniref:Nucleolar GTP-binding protein 2 n=1 Tax=Phytophthora megakarya TaxID=4795 RepID=A0A225WSY5_9STRA|nr:Nucleolar GTP-binding protein 2 [Phytophthora megakarya]